MLVLVVLALGEFIDACEALAEFFAGLSVRSDVSFLILDSPACDPEDPLWRQLAVFGHLVALAVDGAALVPGCVLFVPRDHDVRLGDGVLHLHAAHEPNLDHLLIAASQRFTSDAVAILGPGVDGARGARAIRAADGEVLHLRLQSANTEATRGCVPPPADSHDTPQALAEHLSARLRARQRSPAHTAKTLDDLERRFAALAATCAEFERRNAELARSRDAEALLETSGVAGLLLDRQLKVRHYTSAFCECVPLTPDDVGRPLAELPCTFDRPRERLHFVAERTLRDGQVRVDQVQDRRGHLYLRRFAPLVAGDVVTGVALTLVDISGVAANEAARARRHADRLHQLMVHLPQGILSVLDEELVHREIYGKELARLNVPPRDILGHHLEEIYSAESAARIREHALTEKRLISFENSFGAQTYLVSALPIPAVDGDHYDLLVLSTNVTELRSAREALHAAKDAAERANSARLAFLASMSHELRTPLAGMLGLLEIIDRESDVGEASRLHLLRLRYLVDIQERLISDLLDLSRIDAQQLHLRIASFDVHQVLTELVADTFCSRDDL